MRYRTDYSAQSLSSEPDILFLDGWQLRYQAFAARADDPRPPVLLLGGAFQSFRSFTGEVSELLAEHPVILLDLPSQGGNLQLAAELSLEDLADLIAAFAEQLGLPPLMPIGLSYGSALAALFAARHPRRCALLLAGITAFGRPGARLLLEEALARLDEGDQSAFAHGVLTGLINPLQLERTGVSPVFRKAMLRQLQRLTAAEIERYRQNSRRLLAFGGFERHPTCPTLVLAGEYDHFTQPWEHAVFAHACGNAEFALIHDADHLAQFERREACARLYGPFLRGEALPERAGARGSRARACSAWSDASRSAIGQPRGTLGWNIRSSASMRRNWWNSAISAGGCTPSCRIPPATRLAVVLRRPGGLGHPAPALDRRRLRLHLPALRSGGQRRTGRPPRRLGRAEVA